MKCNDCKNTTVFMLIKVIATWNNDKNKFEYKHEENESIICCKCSSFEINDEETIH